MLGRRDKAKGLEAELQGLETRLAGVQARLADATTRHEAAVAEQRRFLTETDGADARQAKAIAEAARRTADDRAALEDAARALAGMVEDAKARLAAERDRRERDRAAGEIEASAALIEEAAVRLDDAAFAFDAAREYLVRVCREHAPANQSFGSGPEVFIVSAAARRAGILPREDPMPYMGNAWHTAAVPAAGTTVAAMRGNARAIREGAAPNVRPAPPTEPLIAAVFPEVVTVLSGPAFFRDFLGKRIDLPQPGGWTVPEPIAAEAARRGIGYGPETVPGKAILRIVRTQPAARIEPVGNGSFRGVAFTGTLGDSGKGLPPAPDPVDLGMLPDFSGVSLREAAQ